LLSKIRHGVLKHVLKTLGEAIMSLKFNRISICIFFVLFTFAGINALQAQVPVPGQKSNSAFSIEKSNITERSPATVFTVMSPTSTIPFGTKTNALLDMKGYDQEFIRSFTFKNTSSTNFTINSVDFEKQDNTFDVRAIEPGESLPIDVAPGKTFSVRIAFHAIDRNKLSSNRLLIATEQSKDPIVYPIQALQQPLSDMPWNKHAATASAK
jgi:hypothetical protein